MNPVYGQYALAAVAMLAMVAINIWGVESDVINATLISVISATAWGGVQRGIRIKEKE